MMIRARLVAVTRPVRWLKIDDTPEAFVVYAARVSNPGNQTSSQNSFRLLRYLIRHQHWSPFEMVHAVVEIECPRDIARQILRHRSFAFQEFSQRYAAALDYCTREARRQDRKNRQNSTDDLPGWKRWLWRIGSGASLRLAAFVYAGALRLDVAKECARVVLPEGQTMSRMYMAGSARSWVHYCQVRGGNGTQAEHMAVARACREALAPEFPALFGGPHGPDG